MMYYFNARDAPRHMKRAIEVSETKRFDFVIEDGAAGAQGLVDEDHDLADERAEEVMEYLSSKCKTENEVNPGTTIKVDVSITMAQG